MNDRISPEWKNTNTTSFDDAARIAEVESCLASQFNVSAGRDVPAFEYTPRSITRLHALATASKANTRAASIIASDLCLKTSDYRSQDHCLVSLVDRLLTSTTSSQPQVPTQTPQTDRLQSLPQVGFRHSQHCHNPVFTGHMLSLQQDCLLHQVLGLLFYLRKRLSLG